MNWKISEFIYNESKFINTPRSSYTPRMYYFFGILSEYSLWINKKSADLSVSLHFKNVNAECSYVQAQNCRILWEGLLEWAAVWTGSVPVLSVRLDRNPYQTSRTWVQMDLGSMTRILSIVVSKFHTLMYRPHFHSRSVHIHESIWFVPFVPHQRSLDRL